MPTCVSVPESARVPSSSGAAIKVGIGVDGAHQTTRVILSASYAKHSTWPGWWSRSDERLGTIELGTWENRSNDGNVTLGSWLSESAKAGLFPIDDLYTSTCQGEPCALLICHTQVTDLVVGGSVLIKDGACPFGSMN